MLSAIWIILLFSLFLLATLINSWVLIILGIMLLFLLVGRLPCFRGSESLGAFVLVALNSLPMNIKLARIYAVFIGADFLWAGHLLWGFLIFSILLSVEEILFALVSRILWPYQISLLSTVVFWME